MKLVFICLALILCMTGCTAPAAQTTTVASSAAEITTTAAAEAVLPESSEQVADAAAVEAALGLIVALPDKAENAAYHIDGNITYTCFTFEGVEYYWVMGQQLPAPEFDEAELPHVNRTNWMDYPYTVYWNDAGEGHAVWEDTLQKTTCHLFAMEGTDGDKLAELTVMLLPAA